MINYNCNICNINPRETQMLNYDRNICNINPRETQMLTYDYNICNVNPRETQMPTYDYNDCNEDQYKAYEWKIVSYLLKISYLKGMYNINILTHNNLGTTLTFYDMETQLLTYDFNGCNEEQYKAYEWKRVRGILGTIWKLLD